MSLRPYQTASRVEIRKLFESGVRKVLLWLATGGGKTVVFCDLVSATMKNQKRCLIVVRRRLLVENASQRLFRESIPHGVLMAGHWNYRPHATVQVASIDTLLARKLRPPASLIIIDEAHDAVSKGYIEFLKDYPDAYIVAVTATPYVKKDLSHIAEAIVHPATMQQLIDMGYLTRFKYYAPSVPDLTGVQVSRTTEDYVTEQLEPKMATLTGDILAHWKKIAEGRPTLVFAVNVHHSKGLCEVFNAAGVKAEHCDADTPDKERQKIIRRLECGETKIVSNVGIFCVGVDLPFVSAIVSARPTKSRNLFIQQMGRGTRPTYAEGLPLGTDAERLSAIAHSRKNDCLILDHAGNIMRHGFPTMEPEVKLLGYVDEIQHQVRICKRCFAAFIGQKCPECEGAEPVERDRSIAIEDGELQEFEVKGKTPVEQWFEFYEMQRKKNGYKPAWTYRQMLNRFKIEECKGIIPQYWYEKFATPKKYLFADSPYVGKPK